MAYDNIIGRGDAEALMPEEVAREIIKAAPAASIAMTLMRNVRMSRKQQRMPVLSALAQAYFVGGDTGLKQTTKAAWGNKYLVAEEVAAIVPVPDAVVDDADYPLWDEIKPTLIEAAGALIDAATIFGVGKPVTWGTSIIDAADAAGNEVIRGGIGGRDLVGDITALMKLVAGDGHPVTGVAADAVFEFDLLDLRDDQNRPIYQENMQEGGAGRLRGRPLKYLNNGAWDPTKADAIVGDFSQAIIGVRQDITFKVFEEGVISDDDGNVILNLMQQDSKAMRMTLRVGFQVANPINRRQQIEANRYPFAVLRPAGYVGP